jgi:hypothetical protein
MDATALGHHHHGFPGVTKDAHHLVDVLAKFLRIEMRHDFVEDAGGAVRHGANDIEQDPAGDATPGAVLLPRLAFESLLVFDLIWTQGTGRQAIALGAAPPARPEQGKAPQDGLIFIEENDLAPAGPILQSGQCETSTSQISGIGIEPSGGTTGAQRVFLRSYWDPGSFETSSSISEPSNALPRFRTLCTNSKNPR